MLKRFLTICVTFVLGFSVERSVFSSQVFTDEIPQSHLEKIKDLNKNNFSLPPSDYVKEQNAVNIYSPKKIMPITIMKKIDGESKRVLTENIKVNDKIEFLTAEDTLKNGKLFIRKGTPVFGTVRAVQISLMGSTLPQYMLPGKLELVKFKTKDINGSVVDLYGEINENGRNTGLIGLIFFDNYATTSAAIKKNKIYTLYYK